MGQKHPQAAQAGAVRQNFNPDVEILKQKVFEPHYGEVKLARDKNTQEVMILKEIVVNTKETFDKELAFYTQRVDFTHPNIVRVLGYSTEDKHNFCSTYYKISVYIEVLDRDLSKELEARIDNRVAYTEQEILFIADNLISGLSYFQSQGVSHGDIRPLNIFIDERTCKLSDPFLGAQKGQNGLTAAIIQGIKSHLSPQLLAQVPESKFEITADPYRADVYSLGATLLALSTLTNSEDLYDYKQGTINKQILEERLEIVRYNYSQFTYDLIRTMLTEDEATRPDFLELSNRLLPYQDQIRGAAVSFTQNVTGGYEYEEQRQEGEVAKRSGAPAPTTGGNFDADDLEARIQAALDRTRATFEQVALKDQAYFGTTGGATYENATYVPGNFHTPSYTNLAGGQQATSYTHLAGGQQSERVVRSAAPVEPTETAQVSATYTTTPVVSTQENALRASQTAQVSGTEEPSYAKFITPLISQIATTDYAALKTSGVDSSAGLRKSNLGGYTATGTQDPNTYVPSYTQGASYSYATTYDKPTYDKPLSSSGIGKTSQYTSNYAYTTTAEAEKPLRSSNVGGEYTSATYTSNYGTTGGEGVISSSPTKTSSYITSTYTPAATTSYEYQPVDLSKYGISGTDATGTAGTTGTTTTYSYTSTYVPTTSYTTTYTTNYGTTGQAQEQNAGEQTA